MKHESDDRGGDLSARIASLEQFQGSLIARRGPEADRDALVDAPPLVLGPVPRRSRVFLRGRGGLGAFADLTVTAPRPRQVAV